MTQTNEQNILTVNDIINDLKQRHAIQFENGERFTTSLDVARAFDKRHKDVLAIIDSKIQSAEISAHLQKMFIPASYTDERGRKQRMYKINQDGFIFVVTSFKGIKADIARLAFIQAFNFVASVANDQKQVIADQSKKIGRQHKQLDLMNHYDVEASFVKYSLFEGAKVRYIEFNNTYYYMLNDIAKAVGYKTNRYLRRSITELVRVKTPDQTKSFKPIAISLQELSKLGVRLYSKTPIHAALRRFVKQEQNTRQIRVSDASNEAMQQDELPTFNTDQSIIKKYLALAEIALSNGNNLAADTLISNATNKL